jgi:hypothetical protein
VKPGSIIEFELLSEGRVRLVRNKSAYRSAEASPSRFGAVRGTATVKLSTREIMLLTRGR